MQVGDVISGYETQDGVYLHTISGVDEVNDTVQIEIKLYEPGDQNFAWAVEQLSILQGS